jgi:hypothetical protein
MKSFKMLGALAVTVGLSACGGASNPSDISDMFGPSSQARSINHGPPAGHSGQWWTDPSNDCSYSRAHAPGYSPTWHLILNPHHIGKPNAHAGCPVMLKPGA